MIGDHDPQGSMQPKERSSIDEVIFEAPWMVDVDFGEARPAVEAARIIETLHGSALALDADGMLIYLTARGPNANALSLDSLNRRLGDKPFIEGGDAGWKLGMHPDDYPAAARSLRHSLRTGEPFDGDYRILLMPGEYAWHRFSLRPTRHADGRLTGWYGTGIDVNLSKRTEAALRQREQQLQQIVDAVPVQIWSAGPDGKFAYMNRRYQDFLGFSDDELDELTRLTETQTIPERVHPEDVGRTTEALKTSFMTGIPFAQRYRQRGPDNVYRWTEGRAECLRDEGGAIVQWYGVSLDIDEQVRSEQALRESERTLRQLVETLPAMIDCATPDGEPIYRSQQLREFLGYDLEELDREGKPRLSGTLDAGVHRDDVEGVKAHYAHSLATGQPYARKHRLRRFDGEYRWVETRAAAMRNAEGEIVQWNVICLDIDGEVRAREDLRLAQDRLARASQAASLAELSASIAHEVSQPLAAVLANSHASQRWLATDPPNIDRAKRAVERTIRDSNSIADVVGRIRALFRRSTDKRAESQLGGIITEARALLAEEALRRGVRFDLTVEDNLPALSLDRVQIQQVLVNLIRNGLEAMEAVAGDQVLGIRAQMIGDEARVEVADSGTGIAMPDRIFEPFFTTKGQGMGMGLAISRSIVEAHGGRLWAEQGQPSGSRLIFTLPITAKVS